MPTTDYDIKRAFERIENELQESMIRNLKRHRAQEIAEGFDWEMWQEIQLRELDRFRRENANLFGEEFQKINADTESLLRTAYQGAWKGESASLSKALNAAPVFMGINQDRLKALIDATVADFNSAEYAMLRTADDQYRRVIFDAQVYATTTGSYEKAVDMATKDFLRAGINCVEYKNGARHTLANYASMALRTGQKRAYLMGQGAARDQYGVHTVRVNSRTDACPKCVKWLNRVLVDDVYSGGTKKEAVQAGVPTLSQAIAAGFLHPNCKDIYSTYLPGISRPAKEWTKEEINELVGDYNTEQELAHAESMADTYKRMSRLSLDPDNQKIYGARAKYWSGRARTLRRSMRDTDVAPINHTGIREQIEIEYTSVALRGLHELEPGTLNVGAPDLVMNDASYYTGKLSKRIAIPWDSLSDDAQAAVRWRMPSRYKKDLLIQKDDLKDLFVRKGDLPASISRQIQAALDAGYKLEYEGYLHKYNTMSRIYILSKDGKMYLSVEGVSATKSISEATVRAIRKRADAVSKALWDKKVRFRDLTSRQGDDWVRAMTEFHTATGADKPVTLVSRAAYEKVKGEELYRGIAPVSHLRGDISMTKTPMDCARQLMEGGIGDCFPSRGIYGDVVAYVSNSRQTAFDYATGRGLNPGGVIARMKIKEDAKVIEYKDAVELFNQINAAMPDEKAPYFSRRQARLTRDVEVGKAMQLLGYDAIYEPHGDGMNVHFYMILNRDAIVAVKDEWLEAEITDRMIRRGRL